MGLRGGALSRILHPSPPSSLFSTTPFHYDDKEKKKKKRKGKRRKEFHAYHPVARHGQGERGREDRFLKKRKSVLLRACSFKSDKCTAGNMTEKNNTEECVLETRGKEEGGLGLVDRGLEESKN